MAACRSPIPPLGCVFSFFLYSDPQSRQTRPVKRPPSLEAPLQPSLSLSCATLARPCRCALPPNRRAPPPNTPTRRAARHPDGRPDPHFRLRAHASASRAAELIAAGIVGSSSETRGSAGTFRHGTYHGTSERESGASRARNPPHAPTTGRLGRSTGLAAFCVRPECTNSTTDQWSGAPRARVKLRDASWRPTARFEI